MSKPELLICQQNNLCQSWSFFPRLANGTQLLKPCLRYQPWFLPFPYLPPSNLSSSPVSTLQSKLGFIHFSLCTQPTQSQPSFFTWITSIILLSISFVYVNQMMSFLKQCLIITPGIKSKLFTITYIASHDLALAFLSNLVSHHLPAPLLCLRHNGRLFYLQTLQALSCLQVFVLHIPSPWNASPPFL